MTLQLQIVRKKLTPDEISSPTIRWNEDCDCVQQTPDGGTTWIDVPGQDPRIGDGFRQPPLATDDPQCDAAANMVAYLRKLIDIDLMAITNWTLASSLLATLLLVFPGGVLVDLLLIVADVILTIGSSTISAAFTEDVYDGLLCIYFNHLETDGQMTSDDLAAIATDIEAAYPGTVYDVWFAHNRYLFENGWNNAGASGSETGDCSACDCSGCFQWDFTINEQGWVACGLGIYDTGLYWEGVCLGGLGSNIQVNIGTHFDGSPCPITHFEMDVNCFAGASDWYVYGLETDTGLCGGGQTLLASGNQAAGFGTITADFASASCFGLQIVFDQAGACGTGNVYLIRARMESSDLCAVGLTPNC